MLLFGSNGAAAAGWLALRLPGAGLQAAEVWAPEAST